MKKLMDLDTNEVCYRLIMLVAVVTLVVVAHYAYSDSHRWAAFVEQHHCEVVDVSERSPVPMVPRQKLWRCDGGVEYAR